ncbi:MAG: phosphoribosylformylglycinamidine cyclo-ligase, partial [Synergistaceae bacterium]|nr:phosphoribosylformylglycinamidine cyclo-ligase [Synergistaceae bacterium]
RALPDGLSAKIDTREIKVPPIFDVIMSAGDIQREEMFHVFNMGVGMMLVCGRDDADFVAGAVNGAYVAGEIVEGEGGLLLC